MTLEAPNAAGAHAGATLCERSGFEVVDCESCGFAHVLPLPTEQELEQVYAHEYYATEKPLYLERAESDRAWWERLHDGRLARVEELLGARVGRLLDVGSGPGLLLQRARARGWQVLGVEPSHQAAEHARSLGVPVRRAFLTDELEDELAESEGPFDCIHAAEVLEHLPDPHAMLARMRRMLAPGGVLVLSVPNDFNPFQAAFVEAERAERWWVAPPHHLNYFDFESLEASVRRHGLEPVRRETTFPIDLFLLMGEDYTNDDALGRRCHARRMRFEETLRRTGHDALLDDLYDAFAGLGLGRHAVVYAQGPAA